jgi:hypothetical protein
VNIGLYNVDSKIPNLALMKISAYHKSQGDSVAWFSPIEAPTFGRVYASSVFTWSDKAYVTPDMICGGSGFNLKVTLPESIEQCDPDYSLYPDFKQALGFLTRGCIRKCPWCFVPEKEGMLRPYWNIERVAGDRKELVLMDNNFLAAGDYAREQAEKIIAGRYKIDFNQGLDARLIDDSWARMLSQMKWIRFIRLACDTSEMIEPVAEAVKRLAECGVKPYRISVYALIQSVDDETMLRIVTLRDLGVDIFAQGFRPPSGEIPSRVVREFCRWINVKKMFKNFAWDFWWIMRSQGLSADQLSEEVY